MSRLFLLLSPSCLLVLGCSTPSSPPPAAPSAWVAPLAAGPPADAGTGTWTTGLFAAEAVAPAPRAPAAQLEQMSSRHVTLLFGERMLDEDDWDPVEDQLAGGVEVDGTDPSSGHGYEVGLTYSQDDDDVGPVDVTGSTFDVYGGYRYTFRPDAHEIHPYLSAGLAVIRAEVEVDGPGFDNSDDDVSPGAYVRAGIGFDLSDRTRIGVDYRHMFLTDVDIGGISDADFDQIMVTLGFAF
jgi:opacity protein-like surface antigen